MSARRSGPVHAAGLDYLRRGWSVIPVRPRDKHPLIPWQVYQQHGPHEGQLREWFERWPDANVGIVTGAVSGLLVLDVDNRQGGDRQGAHFLLSQGEAPSPTCQAMSAVPPPPSEFRPAYLDLLASGELGRRVEDAWRHMEDCDLCARYCHVNRLETIRGAVCRTGERARVHSYGPHHGEEDPLRGYNGSGTIFFSWCSLRCVFCQNWDISQKGMGRDVTPQELAGYMLDLQRRGCHNINFVTPSHVVAQIIAAVHIAAQQGLKLPLVYNTGGYDSPEALALLDGIIDIYMPDMKYGDSALAHRYSHVRNYVEVNRAAVREMHRQVGDLQVDGQGIARRGLLVRHMVMPENIAGTDQVLAFLAGQISPDTYLNLMDQYHPCYRADENPPLDRPVTREEYAAALALARRHGLWRLDSRRAFGGIQP